MIIVALLSTILLKSWGVQVPWYTYIQTLLSITSLLVTSDSVRRLTSKSGLPVLNRVIGWVLLGESCVTGLLQRTLAQIHR